MEIFKKEKAMTLIELLVVIAIIFILAAIAYTQLWGARKSAKEAQVKATMSGLPAAGEVYYLRNGYTYIGFDSDPNFTNAQTVCESDPYPGTWDKSISADTWTATCTGFADGVTFTCTPDGCQ